VSVEAPPPGCEADALKLYVGNIPTSYSVDDIRQVFKQYGRVSRKALWTRTSDVYLLRLQCPKCGSIAATCSGKRAGGG
jgi:RNA recognition motif-containing protein